MTCPSNDSHRAVLAGMPKSTAQGHQEPRHATPQAALPDGPLMFARVDAMAALGTVDRPKHSFSVAVFPVSPPQSPVTCPSARQLLCGKLGEYRETS